ncbi:hypothetical protein BDK51DRAFT_28074 [Blyttiomyces helicus]|uniref:Uncharacterized protein n=1 Tax=Blyttiomyces helicus TaxID=388810 RepID=A0A4V1IRD7_9FUNG|nr:hypothetical protein BDK51DRAFT_28074 [Blyttiomyces helicus]|eukprot:RKO89697.1 hypothetical protein BDK51DRAFT_28074 [Blyttiomyces helicus]
MPLLFSLVPGLAPLRLLASSGYSFPAYLPQGLSNLATEQQRKGNNSRWLPIICYTSGHSLGDYGKTGAEKVDGICVVERRNQEEGAGKGDLGGSGRSDRYESSIRYAKTMSMVNATVSMIKLPASLGPNPEPKRRSSGMKSISNFQKLTAHAINLTTDYYYPNKKEVKAANALSSMRLVGDFYVSVNSGKVLGTSHSLKELPQYGHNWFLYPTIMHVGLNLQKAVVKFSHTILIARL